MLDPGTSIGPYEIVMLLGAGGMGEVYRARDPRLERMVALKVLPPQMSNDAGRRQRFEQEARAASALNHPNILSVYDIGEQAGLVYMICELIEGETLREMIKRGPLPVSRLVELSSQTAMGLAAAHSAGVVHRDIKPENIMVTRDGRAKILDFGLAKHSSPTSNTNTDEAPTQSLTATGHIMGTAAYMSPEQIRGDAVDHRSDIFSLGLVIYECIMGRQPFERSTSVEVMTAILREDPPQLPESVSPSLREVVWHCLEKDPELRFHSARDLGFALRTATSGSRSSGSIAQIPQSGSEPSLSPPPHPKKRSGWLWPVVALIMTALVAALAVPHVLEQQPVILEQYRLTPFATDVEVETGGAWSPDGKSIAYLKTVNGIPQLMVRELSSTSATALTNTEFPVRQVFWAPDSNLLYFVLQAGAGELWAISPAGGQPSRILDRTISAAVSPDGKALAIWRVSADGKKVRGAVWISSPPGSEPRQYLPAPYETPEINVENRLAFSPDGKSILLLVGSGASQAWLLPFPAGGAAPKRIFAKTDLGVSPKASWLPDSRHVIMSFAPSLNDGANLWLADVHSERMRKLTEDTLGHDEPSVSPDGRRLVYSNVEDDYNVVELPIAGGQPKTLLANSRNELSPSWSPQGDQIAYSTDRTGEREIWIRNPAAGTDRPAVTAREFSSGTTTGLTSPIFSPDGSRIAFLRYSSEEPATVWVATAAGGAPVRLTREFMQSPVWAPDGGSVAGLMERDNPGEPAIVGVGADMTPHLIPNAPLCRTPLAWSPTADWLACETRDAVALFSADGANQRTLPQANAISLVFSQDGNTLYAVGKERGRSFLKAIDVASGAARVIADYGAGFTFSGGLPYHTRLSISADGKSLATSAVSLKSDLWLLEGYPMPWKWWEFWK